MCDVCDGEDNRGKERGGRREKEQEYGLTCIYEKKCGINGASSRN
jgi:hypothetical protein